MKDDFISSSGNKLCEHQKAQDLTIYEKRFHSPRKIQQWKSPVYKIWHAVLLNFSYEGDLMMGRTSVLKRRKESLSMEKYTNPPDEWVTNDPKLFPTMQCHAGPYNASNSCNKESIPTWIHMPSLISLPLGVFFG